MATQVVVSTAPVGNPLIVTQAPVSPVREGYAAKQSLVLGAIQIVVGGLCIIFNSVGIGIWASVTIAGTGIWCGILFIMAGVFGITASKYKTSCHIVTFMVLTIICSVCTFSLFLASSIGLGIDNTRHFYYYSSYSYNYGSYGYTDYHYRDEKKGAKLAMNSLLLILSVIEFVCAIWSSAICCSNMCCNRPQRGVVLANPSQQVMVTQPGMHYPQQVQFPQQAHYPQQPGMQQVNAQGIPMGYQYSMVPPVYQPQPMAPAYPQPGPAQATAGQAIPPAYPADSGDYQKLQKTTPN